ncbi:MAG: site-specific integrase [Rikenellaceae bacterium]
MTIDELCRKTVAEMIRMGLTERTAWGIYSKVYRPIIKWHTEHGATSFNEEIMKAFTQEVEERLAKKEFGFGRYRDYMRGIERLTEMAQTGTFIWKGPKFTSKYQLNSYFEEIMNTYLDSRPFSKKGYSDATWICKKYFAWLMTEGFEDLTTVGATEIQNFMIYCSRQMRTSSLHDAKLYMKKLYQFLYEHGDQESSFKGLFEFKVCRESKMYPAANPDEVNKVLDSIDRNLPLGKRNYAIILLGITLGLRAIDIAKLKLTDIDWLHGEIHVMQQKTGKLLILPLTEDVGHAIKDYILNGRPKTESESVFIRARPPLTGLTNGNSIGDMFDDYRKKLGLPREAFDGKCFHSLRRYVGKNMITSGISVNTLAQVLGDEKIDSVKKYIALDSVHLKECALDFSGIEMGAVK